MLGISLADTTDQEGVIGQFGSGNKHGVAVCLRNDIAPLVFCGTLKLEFFTKPQTVADRQASKEFARVCVKYGGSDPATGANRSSTEDLGFVLDYGKQDWNEVALALREFVIQVMPMVIVRRLPHHVVPAGQGERPRRADAREIVGGRDFRLDESGLVEFFRLMPSARHVDLRQESK